MKKELKNVYWRRAYKTRKRGVKSQTLWIVLVNYGYLRWWLVSRLGPSPGCPFTWISCNPQAFGTHSRHVCGRRSAFIDFFEMAATFHRMFHYLIGKSSFLTETFFNCIQSVVKSRNCRLTQVVNKGNFVHSHSYQLLSSIINRLGWH